MTLKHLQNLTQNDLENKLVILRVDWNVPIQNSEISDTTRILSSIRTINYLKENKAKVLILTHFGRPKTAKEEYKKSKICDLFHSEEEFSIIKIKSQIEEILDQKLIYIENLLLSSTQTVLSRMEGGDIALCENVRFYGGEEANDDTLSQHIANFSDIFINDAFACCHRTHVTTVGLTKNLPSYAGFNLANEVNYLEKITQSPQRPLWAIVGGSKISTKISILQSLIQKVDGIIITGAMAHTFLKAQNVSVGTSLSEPNYVETALDILNKSPCDIVLPIDGYASISLNEKPQLYSVYDLPGNKSFFDIGPESINLFESKLKNARTILWNGPSGVFEQPPYDKGTMLLAQLCAKATTMNGVITIAGGGDTLAALAKTNDYFGIDYSAKLSFLSTAGGAFLEWIEKGTLPGVTPLYE